MTQGILPLDELIKLDHQKNNNMFSGKDVADSYLRFVESGANIQRIRNTVFIVYKEQGSVVFYHTINADPAKRFLRNLKEFFAWLAEFGYAKAVTFFNNPKLQVFYKHPDYVTDSIEPEWTYMGVSDLRSHYGLG
jgi:hypothetical protein